MLDIEEKEDSAEKLAAIDGKPTKHYLFAEEVNKIVQTVDGITETFENINEINTIIVNNGFEKEGAVFTGFADSLWNINGVRYTNTENQEITIPLCATGMFRTDRVVVDTDNNFVLVQGVEVAANPVAESKPVNTLDYTFIPVNDTEVGDPTPPVLGNYYVKKDFDRAQIYNGSGSNIVIPLNPNGYSNIYLEGTITSVDGFNFSELIANPTNAEYPHEGKKIRIYNRTSAPITLNHEITNPMFFQFTDASNIVIPVNESLELVNNSYSLVDVDKSFTTTDDVTGLQAELDLKADLVAGKVPSSQLPSYVDDVLEFANLADFPVSGEASKIYLALDTNFTYRWTGSVYLKISDTGKLDKVTSSGVERAYIINADGTQSTKPTSDFGTIKGTGTTNRISKFTAGGTIGGSQIFDDGTNVGIGTTTPGAILDVKAQGALSTNIVFRVRNSTDTQNFLVVNGAGDVYNNGAGGVNSNTFFGEYVGRNSTGMYNTGFGFVTLLSVTTGNNNSAFGAIALKNTTGNNNSAFGAFALERNTTGFGNSGFGLSSLYNNTTGAYNTAFGFDSLVNIVDTYYNIGIGMRAGQLTSDGVTELTKADYSIFIGDNTRASANNQTNQIVIGSNAIGDGSNSVVLGNSSITRTRLQGQVIIGTFATAPTGIEGAIYYNSTNKKHYGFNGTTWNALY